MDVVKQTLKKGVGGGGRMLKSLRAKSPAGRILGMCNYTALVSLLGTGIIQKLLFFF